MLKQTIICFILISFSLASDFQGAKYEAQTRQEKLSQLWDEISKDKTSAPFPTTWEQIGIFRENMGPTFNHVADKLPVGRRKFIHSQGVVAKVNFEASQDTPYTGVFKGSDSALIRLSLAAKPDLSKTTPAGAFDNFTPGFGLKFLRDDIESANILAMFGVNGFDSWNFFEKDASNHIGPATGFKIKALVKKFTSATPHTNTMGLSQWAQFDQEGEQQENLKFPFKIVFKATSGVKSMFGSEYKDYFLDQLQQIKKGTHLYDVYAVDTPLDDCKEVYIGKIVLESDFITSKFGDENLFFKHNFMEDDFKFQPEWKEYTPYVDWLVRVSHKETKCPFFGPGK